MDKAPIIRIAENPVPEALECYFLRADDGGRLRVAFLPCENAKATVLVHPGWSEFLEKYIEVAEDLHRRGFNVMLCDPRGQGYSQRLTPSDSRGLILDFKRFQADFETMYQGMKTRFDGPYLITAHSMGGLITLDWLAAGNGEDVAGVALAAPLTRLFPERMKRIVVRNIARWGVLFGAARKQIPAAPEHSMNFESNTLTKDPRRHERFKQLQLTAPEAQAGSPRFGWLNAAQTAMMRIGRADALAKIDIPILLVSADDDVTVDPTHHRELAAENDNIHLVRIENAWHEVLMERDDLRNQFWKAFDAYTEERLASVEADKTKLPPETSSTTPSNSKSSSVSAT